VWRLFCSLKLSRVGYLICYIYRPVGAAGQWIFLQVYADGIFC
jgi:hypothetical protein